MPNIGARRLADLIRRERHDRDITQRQLAAKLGVSLRVVNKLESGVRQSYTTRTIDAVETAMRWAPGSLERILDGGEPIEAPDGERDRLEAAWRNLSVSSRQVVARLAEDLARRDKL